MDHLSLVELNTLIQDTLQRHLATSYWVVAEIGELKVNQKGHCYLELVQNDNNRVIAKARATIWSYTYRNLSTWFQGITGQPLTEGLKILANVKISFHELYGFSLNIQDIDASYTIGEKERLRQEVINRLIKDGVMDINKQLTLPMVPQNIAVISAPTAAGYGDFIEHIEHNPYNYHIRTTLFKAIMQGDQAPQSIISVLHKINESKHYDLVVLIRGGGSQLDLNCFDDYNLCTHLAQFPIPIITGIGHERDETIADMVAHTKLKTPTAVAEFIIQGVASFENAIDDEANKIAKTAQYLWQNAALTLQNIAKSIYSNAKSSVLNENHQLSTRVDNIKNKARAQLIKHDNILEQITNKHQYLSPLYTFKRGYSFSSVEGKPIKGQKISKGQHMTTFSLDQIIESSISTVSKNDKI